MSKLSHLDEEGRARMVDVGAKQETARTARAVGEIRMSPEAFAAIRDGSGTVSLILIPMPGLVP